MTRPNNIATNYGYDNLSHLLSVLHQIGSTTLDGATYVPDNAGNRKSKTDMLAGVTSNYTYDPIYELTQVKQAANTVENYTYDAVGNRLTSLSGSYANNTSNELTSSPTSTFQYDYNGNTISKTDSSGATNYGWDFENRLTTVTLPGTGGTVSFKYDPFGRRIQKSFTTGANPPTTTTTNYLYDGSNLIEEVDLGGNMLARYSQSLNIDAPLAMLRTVTSYYQTDGLGSVTSLSNPTGSLAQTYTFDSLGKQTASSGSLTNPFRYTGREFDTETSMYYYRARYYDPNAGRFLSEDPVMFKGGKNFYAYVGNNPLSFKDSMGLAPISGSDCRARKIHEYCDSVRRNGGGNLRSRDGTERVSFDAGGFLNGVYQQLNGDQSTSLSVGGFDLSFAPNTVVGLTFANSPQQPGLAFVSNTPVIVSRGILKASISSVTFNGSFDVHGSIFDGAIANSLNRNFPLVTGLTDLLNKLRRNPIPCEVVVDFLGLNFE